MDTNDKAQNGTDLQAHLDALGCHSIPFNVGGKDYSQSIFDMPDATIIRVLAYGKRMMNDYVNSAKATSDTPADELAAGWIKRAKAGTLGAGGGSRTSLDPMQKAIREVVVEYLKASGMKVNEARLAAKTPEKAFERLLATKLAMATEDGVVTDDQIATAFDANWPKVESAARAIVDASAGLSIDL